jgi:DnaJ domain
VARQTYYEVLGIPRDASTADIRDAYRALAMRWHPDRNRNPEALERFKLINVAYQTLSETESRRRYDARLASKGAWTSDEGLSDQQAYQIFLESMLDLGHELAARGYDQAFILRALTSEGCPPDIAAAVARSCVRNASSPRGARAESWRFTGEGAPRPPPDIPPAKKRRRPLGFAWAVFKGLRVVISLVALVYFIYIISAVSIMTGNAPKWLAQAWKLMGNETKAGDGLPSLLPGFLSADGAKVKDLAKDLQQHYRSIDPDVVTGDKPATDAAQTKAPTYGGGTPQPAQGGPSSADISWTAPPPAPSRPAPVRSRSAQRPDTSGANSCNSDQDCPASMTCNRRSVNESWRCMPR